MNLNEWLDGAIRRWPQKAAIVEGSDVVSYGELGRRVGQGSWGGGRVGLRYANSSRYIELTFALWKAGATVVPIPMECTEDEVVAIAEKMGLEGVLSGTPDNRSVCIGEGCHYTKFSKTPADSRGMNIAFIRFTSGTTNDSKGVVLCHETVRDRILAANKGLKIGADDVVMWCLPMSHHFLVTIVLYLAHGATIVLAPNVLPGAFLELANRWKVTVLYAAPFHYAMLARGDSEAGLASVRLAVSTTCGLTKDVADDFFKRFGFSLSQGLGIMEAGLVCLNTADPRKRWNSVGQPLEDYEIRIVSPDEDGNGEVAVRGPGMFDAYADPWKRRDEVLRDGWFHTGDIGCFDNDGFLFLAGRKTSVINLAGRKVFPEEIEAVLNRHPAVCESRAYGRAHSHLGEVVEAELVLRDSGADLNSVRDLCRASLAPFKIPTRFHVVNALLRTKATGKILRPSAAAHHD